MADLRYANQWLHPAKISVQWLGQPYVGIFGVWSHQMTQRKSAIQWLQWLQRKLAIYLPFLTFMDLLPNVVIGP